jgi:hypothetical protein
MALAAKLGWSALANRASLHDNLVRIYADLPRLLAAILVHLGVWFVGVLEVLVALRLMGFPVSYGEALAIESVGQAVRAAAFLMPGALGVQEKPASSRSARFLEFRRPRRWRCHWSNGCRTLRLVCRFCWSGTPTRRKR